MSLRSPSCLLLLLVLLVPAAPLDPGCVSNEPCPDTINCTGCNDDTSVADPEDCHKFYICIGEDHGNLPLPCDPGEYFNATSHQCAVGECEDCPVVPPTGNCIYECPANGTGVISSSTDCNSYYECKDDGNLPELVTCEKPNTFFNGEKCQDDVRLCCHCHPYCTVKNTYIVDPLDCRSYYYCATVGGEPIGHDDCSEGEYFDSILQNCYTTAGCETQVSCLNVVQADGCIDPFTCISAGYFARCPKMCTPDFYHCENATGTFQDASSCTDGKVYHPDRHNCVVPDDCPYGVSKRAGEQ